MNTKLSIPKISIPLKRKYKKIQLKKLKFTEYYTFHELFFFKNIIFNRLVGLKIKQGKFI